MGDIELPEGEAVADIGPGDVLDQVEGQTFLACETEFSGGRLKFVRRFVLQIFCADAEIEAGK